MFVAVTDAPGTRLLLASTTVPVIVPLASCAAAVSGAPARRTTTINRATLTSVVYMHHLFCHYARVCAASLSVRRCRARKARLARLSQF